MENERLYALRDTDTGEWLSVVDEDSAWILDGEPLILTQAEAFSQARRTPRGTQIVRVVA